MPRSALVQRAMQRAVTITLAVVIYALPAGAQQSTSSRPSRDVAATIPDLSTIVGTSSEMAPVVNWFASDQDALESRYDAPDSPAQRTRMRAFYEGWAARLGQLSYDKLSIEARVDYVLLDHYLTHQLALMDRQERERQEMSALLPFADSLLVLQDRRRALLPLDDQAAAHDLAALAIRVDSMRALVDAGAGHGAHADSTRSVAVVPQVSRAAANRAADAVDAMHRTLGGWYRFYDGFDPLFTWWAREPYGALDSALTNYARTIRERLVGMHPSAQLASAGGPRGEGRAGEAGSGMSAAPNEPIIGDPIGAQGLKADLDYEMIPYTPEELITIAQQQYAFSLSEAKKAAREMGFGDNWKAAMEKVKNTYVDPGKQPELIRTLARQAEDWFDAHDWVTIPKLAEEDWRTEMLSPARQRVSPFFLGGDLILVSYPTDAMTDEEKLMSMRGNNPHFSHATVFHELNPGHHLQGFMAQRYNTHRQLFDTPFWSEGQSLYWEMFAWDHGFDVSPEDRLGALFWRMHRSARIIFSMSFHLGKMTPEQAIQFLVDTVDFERANAEGEVRRSFNGSYSPLYQIGYMIGGLELRALHHELVDTHKMTERQFHDAVLEGGPMPIAMVRARLEKLKFAREGPPPWRFADELPAPVPAP